MANKNSSTGTVKRIDTRYFNDAIRELNDAISIYGDAKTNICSSTDTLVDSWEGKGRDKFNDAYKRLKRELTDQCDNLVAMRDSLQTILETYQNWDSENAASISGNQVTE